MPCSDRSRASEEVDAEVRAMTAVATRKGREARERVRRARPLAGLFRRRGQGHLRHAGDFATSYGSPIYADHRPKSDAAIVTLLKRNGAGARRQNSDERICPHGADRRQRNRATLAARRAVRRPVRPPAVAAGIAPFAISSQTGGSTIRPASFCASPVSSRRSACR